jgi:hypothetical protein
MSVITPTRTKRAGKTTSADLKLGEKLAPRIALYTGINRGNASIAFATCRISICGWCVGTHDGTAPRNTIKCFKGKGRWFRTDLTTFGDLPSENFTRHKNGRVAWSDNVRGLNDILGIFNLSTSQIIDRYGDVEDFDRLDVTLAQIVRDMTNFAKPQTTRVC